MAFGLDDALSIGGLALSGISSIFGASQQAKQARKIRRELDQEEKDNEQWYNMHYNKVGRERADAQRALTAMREAQKARMQRSAGAQAVAGASEESAAAEKAAANKAMGDTVSAIDAQQEARKDKIEEQYQAEKKNIRKQRVGLAANTQAQTAAATSQALNLAGNIIAGSGSLGKSKSPSTQAGSSNLDAWQMNSDANNMVNGIGSGMSYEDYLKRMQFNSKW